MSEPGPIPFVDLSRAHAQPRVAQPLAEALTRVLRSGTYILGGEVDDFETAFARFAGTRFAVGVASGTDAITLALWVCGLRAGDRVVVPAFTANPTVVGLERAGGVPLFADADPRTFLISAATAGEALARDCEKTREGTRTREGGHPVRFLMPVHLYGAPCPMDELSALAAEWRLTIVEDACQAHGARWGGRPAGTWGKAGCFSFYPTKNLGALGDGGAVVTDDPALVERLRLLRFYGQQNRVRQIAQGLNSRLDEIQAAVLRAKLPHVPRWNKERAAQAARYREALSFRFPAQEIPAQGESAHHLFVVRVPDRASLRQRLDARGVGTAIHYEVPAHRHPVRAASHPPCPEAERLAADVVSLPLYPGLRGDEQDAVIRALLE